MRIALLLLFTFAVIVVSAQDLKIRNYSVQKTESSHFSIDGELTEPEWQSATWENEFIQFEPYNGRTPSQRTEFALLYDENNVFVGIKSFDNNPDSISLRMTRRDIYDGDMAGIMFDTYNDKRTGFSFIVSAAG
ncbi:MAG TPA: hydrolase, partial [Prolixibacteraceae bacterium]|nr:hydrolase [Prolixibacteraceae bacterium]